MVAVSVVFQGVPPIVAESLGVNSEWAVAVLTAIVDVCSVCGVAPVSCWARLALELSFLVLVETSVAYVRVALSAVISGCAELSSRLPTFFT